MSKPNFVFITADQQRGDCYGFMGRKIKTPHLDQLRSEGAWLESKAWLGIRSWCFSRTTARNR